LLAQGRRSPLSSSFTSPAREPSLCRRAMSLYMVEREVRADVTARCRSSFLRTLSDERFTREERIRQPEPGRVTEARPTGRAA
jgi:hypothetical protein